MAEGRLIVEVYEYAEEAETNPVFEYISCPLKDCLVHNKATMEEIIQRGFGITEKERKLKRNEILKRLEDAGINKIGVRYNKPRANAEPYVELTNIVQMSMTDADASRRKKKNSNDIILYGKYRFSDGTETTRLRDAQRLTLIYASAPEYAGFDSGAEEDGSSDGQKEICLNITYLQE